MIGLMVEGKPLVRAYSMVSPPWDEELEFLSIKVQNGPLTSRLQHIKVGDTVLIGRKPTGTLLVDNLLPGQDPVDGLDRHRPRPLHVADPRARGL